MSRSPYRVADATQEHAFIGDGDDYDIAVVRRYDRETVGPDGKPLDDAEWQGLIDTIDTALKPTFSDRELATVLAALRAYSSDMCDSATSLAVDDIATDGGSLKPLDNDEIAKLCERINQ